MNTMQLESTVVERRISHGALNAGRACRRSEWGSAATVEFLDRSVPLDGASHADVVRYAVHIPTRYARCFAVLADDSKVDLRDPRQFIGWSRRDVRTSFLFALDGLCIEVETDPDHPAGRYTPGNVCRLVLASVATLVRPGHDVVGTVRRMTRSPHSAVRKFVAIDGSQIMVPARAR